ncbi:MAG: 5-(carboxyamino)imidazole ribonucleotide synthase [Burkholderiales bacterium]|nr:5-(carboxyamino)imidazole ribonucleotide synthase [Burkholderiales bacterium]
MQKTVLAPKCIGILGGGQLGMMLARVAKQFAYKVAILEPDVNCPAKMYADVLISKPYDDKEALDELAKISQVITTEFENVPALSVEYLNSSTSVFPSANSLLIAQNRIKEKTFFRSIGLLTAEFAIIHDESDCDFVSGDMFPAILKTTTLGYDGKGQATVYSHDKLKEIYNQLSGECILEKRVKLKQEVSIIVARNQTGSKVFPLIENQHRNGILDVSYIPAQVDADIHKLAHDAALKIVDGLDYTGLLTIEFFITEDNKLLVNEMAPRPHNSGHITIEAAITSQFEQQLRAVCGLPLGSTKLKQNGAMLNLLGDIWLDSTINPEQVLLAKYPDAKYHSYGKTSAKAARKMGHISITSDDRNYLESSITDLQKELHII